MGWFFLRFNICKSSSHSSKVKLPKQKLHLPKVPAFILKTEGLRVGAVYQVRFYTTMKTELLPLPFFWGVFKICLSCTSIRLLIHNHLVIHRSSQITCCSSPYTAHLGYMHLISKSIALHLSLLNLFFLSLNHPCSCKRRCYHLKCLQCLWFHFIFFILGGLPSNLLLTLKMLP